MANFLKQFIAALTNRFGRRQRGAWHEERGSIDLGLRVVDGEVTKRHVSMSNERRKTQLSAIGITGSGKSRFLQYLCQQDIEADRGFAYFDIHGDATPFLLKTINARERRLRRHLSDKLVLVEPADPFVSVGLNPLEQPSPDFVRIAEFAQVLKQRWGLDHFGARTEELLRNSLYSLSANGLTLVELSPFLTDSAFRSACLRNVSNAEVREYFELRYDRVSEAMRGVLREPVLNKVSAFTADPHFRHIVGQAKSTFSIREAMDEGHWVIVNLAKSSLGEQAMTLGSLIFTALKNAIFAREKRSLFTLYCDEIQNLVAYGSGIETVLSEARKFGVGIVSANQFLNQYPPDMQAAILSIGTHVYFRLSSPDAAQIAQALDGGKYLAERLKNLYPRHCVVKSGADRWVEVRVPDVRAPNVDYTDLLNRTRYTRGRVRQHIDRDIAKRQELVRGGAKEAFHEWQ